MTQTSAHDPIAHSLDACLLLAETLRSALADEHQALEQRDQPLLDDAVMRKQSCIRELQDADPRDRITRVLNDNGLSERVRALRADGTPQAFEAALDAFAPKADLGARWGHLMRLTGECRDMNQRNGLLATRLRTRAEQMLQVIQSAAGIETPTAVYGPDGSLSSAITRLPA
ncbi:MAG: flagellar protein FlgN [Pseudomonadota bacterium]